MASNYTENYGLCQWEATDQVLREEFNQDNAAVDEALKGTADLAQAAQVLAQGAYSPENSPIAVGSYVGDGTAQRTIELGFTPKAVLLMESSGETIYHSTGNPYCYGGLAVEGHNLAYWEEGITNWTSSSILGIVPGGFRVQYYKEYSFNICSNASGKHYYYIAFK